MQTFKVTISISVSSLIVNQGDTLSEEEQKLILTDFLTSSLYFPPYTLQGETNQKAFDIQLIFDKKSPVLNDLIIEENDRML